MEDTIAAVSTAPGVGAISIIRISGKDAISCVNNITKSKKIINALSHTITYDHIIDKEKIVDEVLITVMRGPKTFTCEDVVEINTHGSMTVTNYVLKLILNQGCRLAEAGEFTKRAFLNGRIDLLQAESVMYLIDSKTEKERELSINQLSGNVSNLIKDLREDEIKVISNIEVNIDFPEYDDIEVLNNQKILSPLINIKNKMQKILDESNNGLIIREGIKTVIIGKPNVGKSSLLNRLLDYDKAIVTDIEGTTRDIVEGSITIDGILLNVIDTAGIRKTDNIVESIGVKKSIELIEQADLVLFVINNNDILNADELSLLEKVKNKKYIVVINKSDLPDKVKLPNYITNKVKISALEDKKIDDLKNKIRELFNFGYIETKDLTYLSNARSISLLEQALESLDKAIDGIKINVPIDMVELDLRLSWEILGKIIGQTYEEELIDNLFSRFCLGK